MREMQEGTALDSYIDAVLEMSLSQPWRKEALCRQADPDIFYAKGQGDYSANIAKRVCAQCPVIEPCLEFALRNNEIGVWGGTTERDRKKLKRRNRRRVTDDTAWDAA